MKKILLLSLILMLASCNNDSEPKEDIIEVEIYSLMEDGDSEMASLRLSKNSKGEYYIRKYTNGNVDCESKVETPSIEVNYGYDAIESVTFYPKYIYKFSNSILLLYDQSEYYSYSDHCLYAVIFNNSLGVVKELLVNKSKRFTKFELFKWGEDAFIINATSYNGDPVHFIRYNQYGELIRDETGLVVSGHVTYPIDDYDYINVNLGNAYRGSLRPFGYNSIAWQINYPDYLENKDACGSMAPRAELKKYIIKDGILTIDVAITYCDGELGEAALSIDVSSGRVLE